MPRAREGSAVHRQRSFLLATNISSNSVQQRFTGFSVWKLQVKVVGHAVPLVTIGSPVACPFLRLRLLSRTDARYLL